ncbi:MAG: cyclic nucleotide-binding domain-containing protein [Nitrospiraceae bacterium]|nr:MAG: cyclic nucleotide-binding domain-containing protein [Nitrospiraceae bacterium]
MISASRIKDLSERMKQEFKFFKTLTDEECTAFLSFCEDRQVSSGGTLWNEGDTDNYAAFLISGKLGIKKKTAFKGKYMIVGTFDKGTVVGELCLLTDQARSVTAVVLESAVLVQLSSMDFERLIAEHPMLGLKLLKHIFIITSKRLNGSYKRIASIF